MTLSVQFMTIISMILGGIYLGAALDTYNHFVRRLKSKKWLIYITEAIFWIGQSVFLFYILFRVNYGELRFYVYLACFLGFSIYQALFKHIFLKILNRLIRLTTAIGRFIYNLFQTVLFRPIFAIVQIVVVALLSIIQLISMIISILGKILFYPLILVGKGVGKLLPNRFKQSLFNLFSSISNLLLRFKKWLQHIFHKRR